MAFNEQLADRVRTMLRRRRGVTERKMFGGLCFLLHGNMLCGIVGDELMVRVGAEAHEDALAQPYSRPMDFTGKPLKGMVYVNTLGTSKDPDLSAWIERGRGFAASLPKKG